ncbi:MAG TPA: undecaprenyl-phosphate glucose phosphotransferase [Chloroflexota bacterium]|nr:undecaprenyl-phosphate glucose phosphotransferase [Chloroflexota bacterium]
MTAPIARHARSAAGSARDRLLRPLYVAALLANDILATVVAFGVAYWLLIQTNERAALTQPPLIAYTGPLAVLVGALLLTFALTRLYIPRRDTSHLDTLGAIAQAVTIANVVALAVEGFTTRSVDVPRFVLVACLVGSIGLIWLGRTLLHAGLAVLRRHGWDEARVLIVGAGDQGQLLHEKILAAPELGYRVVGYLDEPSAAPPPLLGRAPSGALASGWAGEPPDAPPPVAARENAAPILGRPADLTRVVREYGIGEVLVALPSLSHQQLVELAGACARERVNVKVFPDVFQIMANEVTTSELSGLPLVRIRDVTLRGWNRALKRATDFTLSAVLLVLLAPLLLFLALAVKLTSPGGPAFYGQERLGLDGRPFQLLKFRSMRVDAEAGTGPVMARPDDDRTTTLGKVMRRLSIDELPQLVNVLLGEMSLVGPRPERPHFVQQFAHAIPRYADRHQEKAGMTGWAQVNGLRGRTSIEERTRYDLFYVEHWSLLFDLKIMLKTLAAIVRDRNAY